MIAPFLNRGFSFTDTFFFFLKSLCKPSTSTNFGIFFFSDHFSPNPHYFVSRGKCFNPLPSLSAAVTKFHRTPCMSSFIKSFTLQVCKDTNRDAETKTSFYVKAHEISFSFKCQLIPFAIEFLFALYLNKDAV